MTARPTLGGHLSDAACRASDMNVRSVKSLPPLAPASANVLRVRELPYGYRKPLALISRTVAPKAVSA